MAKKKKTVQLLPFAYLVKIGRIKEFSAHTWIGDRKIYVPMKMKNDWGDIEIQKPKASSEGVMFTDAGWWVQNNWIKP